MMRAYWFACFVVASLTCSCETSPPVLSLPDPIGSDWGNDGVLDEIGQDASDRADFSDGRSGWTDEFGPDPIEMDPGKAEITEEVEIGDGDGADANGCRSDDDCDDGQLCTIDSCDPATGVCAHTDAICNDFNQCTVDSCDPEVGCVWELGSVTWCDDGNACTEQSTCDNKGHCGNGVSISCDDRNLCTSDRCDRILGCIFTPIEGQACNDGDACTWKDACHGGQCVGQPYECPNNECFTTERCDPEQGCIGEYHEMAPCVSGNACRINERCISGYCERYQDLNCDDGNVCTMDACYPDIGCEHWPIDSLCDDGDACTVGDHCDGVDCVAGNYELWCEDFDPCTRDWCDPGKGCLHDFDNGVACNDRSACSTNDTCLDGECLPGEALDCDDHVKCTKDSCDPVSGCVHQLDTEDCDCSGSASNCQLSGHTSCCLFNLWKFGDRCKLDDC